jgi:hypothetical protein
MNAEMSFFLGKLNQRVAAFFICPANRFAERKTAFVESEIGLALHKLICGAQALH